jgi:hypothetical protein
MHGIHIIKIILCAYLQEKGLLFEEHVEANWFSINSVSICM